MANGSYKLLLRVNSADELLRVPNIQVLIVLCHIYNNISTSHRYLFTIAEQPISFLSNRDNMFMLIVSSSYMYEGIDRTYRLLNNNYNLIPQNNYSDYTWLREQITNDSSFYKNILSNIRNKLGFHFSEDVFSTNYISHLESFPVIIGNGEIDNPVNFTFEFTDTIMMYYLSSLVNSNDSNEDKIRYILSELRDYNIRFTKFIRSVIESIANNYSELEIQYNAS